ncbi:MAG: acetolactate synthase [Chthoniobacterales bacterium]|nr:acetolactate synthase [Chthoniobacterales bacterium]
MASTETTEKLHGRAVRQYSVFLANRVGALMQVVKMLNEARVVVLALSIQDSSETSIARIIVSDPEMLEELFGRNDIPYGVCDVVVAELEEGASDLPRLLAALLEAEVNILFSYTLLVRPRGRPLLAIHTDDLECASAVLGSRGFRLLRQTDLSR